MVLKQVISSKLGYNSNDKIADIILVWACDQLRNSAEPTQKKRGNSAESSNLSSFSVN